MAIGSGTGRVDGQLRQLTNGPLAEAGLRLALYARVSTEEQAERQTVQAQLAALRDGVGLLGGVIVAEYVDEGYSGTLPLGDRPDGRRLLADAADGRFDQVVVYRVDRLARSLKVLMDANDALDRVGVTLRSATEPFDTASPIGRFLFQLLGSMAELERSTITERMSRGRDARVEAGNWTGGPVPFGYDVVDRELDPRGHVRSGRLVPSQRPVDGLELTEAELAASILREIAEGSSTVAQARRLNALGVPTARRYASGRLVTVGETWLPSRINAMVKNTTYMGARRFRSRHRMIEVVVPALVSPEAWQRANDQLVKNRALSTKNANRLYLLRGLIRCGNCGKGYVGASKTSAPWDQPKRRVGAYRCMSQLGAVKPEASKRCAGKILDADVLEGAIWRDIRAFLHDPGDKLVREQLKLRERLAESAGIDDELRALARKLGDIEGQRDRVMTLYRKFRITYEEAEAQLDAAAAEASALRERADSLRSRRDLANAAEAQLADAAAYLATLRGALERIDAEDDRTAKRELIEKLVKQITVETDATKKGRHKKATARVTYAFGDPIAVDPNSDRRAHSRHRGSATT